MGKWVMAERKIIMTEKKREQHGGIVIVDKEPRVYNVGDEAPAGHERRPYTREIKDDADIPRIDMGERIEMPAPNRMAKSGRKRAKG